MLVDGRTINRPNTEHQRDNRPIVCELGTCKLNFNCKGESDDTVEENIHTQSSAYKVMTFVGGSFLTITGGCVVGVGLAAQYGGRVVNGQNVISPWVVPLSVVAVCSAILGGTILRARNFVYRATPIASQPTDAERQH